MLGDALLQGSWCSRLQQHAQTSGCCEHAMPPRLISYPLFDYRIINILSLCGLPRQLYDITYIHIQLYHLKYYAYNFHAQYFDSNILLYYYIFGHGTFAYDFSFSINSIITID
eukprot:TRINITY_DN50423_c0_g1_i1.p3 TRINITY_DN50423_c0_g1~~TRINITY_DN50423_c0_g1_i1.p3  ORF type:complete len:113 (-),score=0.54 TRINITY_DN50423_c0_g1_i1:48-386(-)